MPFAEGPSRVSRPLCQVSLLTPLLRSPRGEWRFQGCPVSPAPRRSLPPLGSLLQNSFRAPLHRGLHALRCSPSPGTPICCCGLLCTTAVAAGDISRRSRPHSPPRAQSAREQACGRAPSPTLGPESWQPLTRWSTLSSGWGRGCTWGSLRDSRGVLLRRSP